MIAPFMWIQGAVISAAVSCLYHTARLSYSASVDPVVEPIEIVCCRLRDNGRCLHWTSLELWKLLWSIKTFNWPLDFGSFQLNASWNQIFAMIFTSMREQTSSLVATTICNLLSKTPTDQPLCSSLIRFPNKKIFFLSASLVPVTLISTDMVNPSSHVVGSRQAIEMSLLSIPAILYLFR